MKARTLTVSDASFPPGTNPSWKVWDAVEYAEELQRMIDDGTLPLLAWNTPGWSHWVKPDWAVTCLDDSLADRDSTIRFAASHGIRIQP